MAFSLTLACNINTMNSKISGLYILSFLLVSVSLELKCQDYRGEATYAIKLAEDLFPFQGTLVFDKNKSSFKHKQKNESRWFAEEDPQDEFSAFQVVLTDTIGYGIFRKYNEEKVKVRSFCTRGRPSIYFDTLNFEWSITNESKIIQNLKCMKATTSFRGRKYEAWFTPTVPIPAGPWKFFGLPGLIIEIKDLQGDIYISLKSLQVQNSNESINDNLNGSIISREDFFECLDIAWVKYYNKNKANIARLQAEFPGLEITDNNLSKKRPATELEFE